MSTGPQLPTTIAGWAIWLVCALAIAALVYVFVQVSGVAIPWWVSTVLWILLVAFIIIGAIRLVSRWGSNP